MSEHKSTMNPVIHLLVLTVFIDLIGFGIIIPLLPQYARTFHATPFIACALMATFSFWQFIFAPILGRWSDRIGRRPVLLVSLGGTILGYAVLAVANLPVFTEHHLPWLWGLPVALLLLFLSRTIDGISGGNISTAQAYIADITTPEDRIKGMGMIGAAFGLGFIFGPVIGSLLVRYGFHWPAIAAGVLAIGNWIWAYKALPESLKPDSDPGGRTFSVGAILRTLTNPLLGKLIVLVFVATFAFASLESTFTMYLQDRMHVDPATAARHIGPYFAYIGFLMAFIQGWAIRRLRGKNLETILVAGGTLSLAIGMLGIALITSTFAVLIPLAFIAFGSGFVNPSLTSLISRRADPNEMGQTLGASQGMSGLARILGPLAAGFLYTRSVTGAASVDPGRPYLAGAVIMGLAFLMALTVHGERNATPA